MYTVNLSEGLFKAGYSLNTDLYRAYAAYIETENAKKPKRSLMEELMSPIVPIPEMELTAEQIKDAASNSSIAVIAIGRNAGEGNDRKTANDYYLTDREIAMIKNVSAAFREWILS